MDRTVRDVMCRGVITCRVDATADEIARIMLDNDVSTLVVIDERLDACGVVSKTDLLEYYGKDLSLIAAEDIMSSSLLTVSPDTLAYDAVQQMLRHRVHQLVIVTKAGAHHRPVGIITSGDIVVLMAGETQPRLEAQMRCTECIRKLLSVSQDNA